MAVDLYRPSPHSVSPLAFIHLAVRKSDGNNRMLHSSEYTWRQYTQANDHRSTVYADDADLIAEKDVELYSSTSFSPIRSSTSYTLAVKN